MMHYDQCDVPKQKMIKGNRVNPYPAVLNLLLDTVCISPTDNVSVRERVDRDDGN